MQKLLCNPLDLEYRYQYRIGPAGSRTLSREAADPTVLLFGGTYYLFASMSGGFWYSDDLFSWQFRETPELPIYDYAPDVRAVGGRVIFSASRQGTPCTFFASSDPLREPFAPLSTPFAFWDPDIFEDDDGRVYFYWGCSNRDPIWGVEIDPATMLPIGEKQALLAEDTAHHGWERRGENNHLGGPTAAPGEDKPYIEGAFMTKHGGRYYLQYAAPGTEYNGYADGVYIADRPLGPYTYQAHNPFSSRPGGFMQAAGHGSTFQDKFGSWWHASTMRISVNESFERRIGLFPCAFDADGLLYCNQNFADYPFALPDGPRTAAEMAAAAPLFALLSGGCAASASSAQPGFGPERGAEESVRTWWAADACDPVPWYQLDLGSIQSIAAVQVNLADHRLPAPPLADSALVPDQGGARHIFVQPQHTGWRLQASSDGVHWQTLLDTRSENSDRPHRLWQAEAPIAARWLRFSDFVIPFGGVPALSGLRVFGRSGAAAPAAVQNVRAQRSADGCSICLQWQSGPGTDGCNVRYGIAPDKLYSAWQVNGAAALTLTMLNSGTPYSIEVDAFGRGGVTPGTVFTVK